MIGALALADVLVADHHEAIAEGQLGVLDPATLALDPEPDVEPERRAQPVDRRRVEVGRRWIGCLVVSELEGQHSSATCNQRQLRN